VLNNTQWAQQQNWRQENFTEETKDVFED